MKQISTKLEKKLKLLPLNQKSMNADKGCYSVYAGNFIMADGKTKLQIKCSVTKHKYCSTHDVSQRLSQQQV